MDYKDQFKLSLLINRLVDENTENLSDFYQVLTMSFAQSIIVGMDFNDKKIQELTEAVLKAIPDAIKEIKPQLIDFNKDMIMEEKKGETVH